MFKGDLIFSVLIFLGSAVLYWVTGTFEGHDAYGKLGPAYWPRFLLGCLMVLGAFVSICTIVRISREKAWDESLMTLDPGKVRFFVAIALIVFYLILLKILGFIIMTPLFMIAFMVLLGEKSRGWMIGISLGMTASIVVLFTKAMYVPLPRGEWLFRSFSLLFY